jgi:hypothetical protein
MFQESEPILCGFYRSRHEGENMKRQALTLIAFLSLLMAAGSAHAQTIRVRANIPFSFSVNNETLPPGRYDLQSFGSADGKTLMIRDCNLRAKALVTAHGVQSVEASKQTKLVFNRSGDQYFLSEIWVAGNDSGHQLAPSSRERESMAKLGLQQVGILARLR